MRSFNYNALAKAVWLGLQYEIDVHLGLVQRSVVNENDE